MPKSIPPWQAAFIEPLACSIHATGLGNIQLEDVVVISGCGPLGLGMVAAARLKNPKKLIALDLLEWKVYYNPCAQAHNACVPIIKKVVMIFLEYQLG